MKENMAMMSDTIGIFADLRKLPQTKLPRAFIATLASERALRGYPFRRQARYRSCRAVILADLEAVPPQTNTMTRRTEVAEQASLRGKGTPKLLRQEVVRAAAVSAPLKTPLLKRHRPKRDLPPGRHLLHPQTGRPRLLDREQFQEMLCSDLALDLAKAGLLLRSTDPRATRHGWQRCTSLTLVSRLTSSCFLLLQRSCNKSNGRKRDEPQTHTIATLHPLPSTLTICLLFPRRSRNPRCRRSPKFQNRNQNQNQ
jgi:hypothetical protein